MKLLLFLLCFCTSAAQAQLKLSLDNPLVQAFLSKAVEQYLPKVIGRSEKVKGLTFTRNNPKGEWLKLKATVHFENPKAALGNGNYRIKLVMGKNLLKPQIKSLKMQYMRIWFIRFYKRVI
jgi:hypothetical protein